MVKGSILIDNMRYSITESSIMSSGDIILHRRTGSVYIISTIQFGTAVLRPFYPDRVSETRLFIDPTKLPIEYWKVERWQSVR